MDRKLNEILDNINIPKDKLEELKQVFKRTEKIAHDFNNLLAVISTCSEFLLDDLKEHDQKRKDVLQIQNASNRAALLVQQLLILFSTKG